MRILFFVIFSFVVLADESVLAEQQPPLSQASQPATTKMEQFSGSSGVVMIKGFTTVGVVKAAGDVSIDAMTFRNAKTGDESKGVVVEIRPIGSYARRSRSFVDYDEVPGLLEGIDYVSATDRSVTKLDDFEAVYRTRGNVSVIVYSYGSKTQVSIQAGSISSENVTLSIDQLKQLRGLIVNAKSVLDNPDSARRDNQAQSGTDVSQSGLVPRLPAPAPVAPATKRVPAVSNKPQIPGAPMPLNQ